MNAARRTVAALVLTLGLVAPGMAVPPNLSFAPPQDADGIPDGNTGTPSFEVVFAGPDAQIVITPSGGSGSGVANQTTLVCQALTGDPQITRNPGVPAFEGATTATQTLDLHCAPSMATTTALLTCTEKKGGVNTATYRWDISCPVAGSPEYMSSPIAGTTLSITTTQPGNGTATLTVTNTGGAPLSVTSITGLSAPVTVAPGSASIGPGLAQQFTLTCSGASAGTFSRNFTVNTNDADEAANGYGVDCTVNATPSPEFAASPPPSTLPLLSGVQGGAAPSTVVTVTNVGTAELTLGPLTGLSPPLSATIGSSNLAPGASTQITITCATAGALSTGPQTLQFTTNDPDDGEGQIGYGVACTIVPPTSAEFQAAPAPPGPLPIATPQGTNGTATVTIQNLGDDNLTLGNIGGLSGVFSASFGTTTIGPGLSTALTVTCNGAVAGSFGPQQLVFATNDPDEGEGSIAYSTSCDVAAPATPEFSSAPVAPGPVSISTSEGVNASGTITVTNVGSATLQIVSITPPAGPVITLAPAGTPPIMLAPQASQVFTLNCDASTASETPYTDSVSFSTNDASEGNVAFNVACSVSPPVAADFDGAPAPPGPLGITTFQTVNASERLLVENLGTGPLQISGVTVGGAPFSVLPTMAALGPGERTEFVVTCDATNLGLFEDRLRINSNDPADPAIFYDLSCRVQDNAAEYDAFPAAGSTVTISTAENVLQFGFVFIDNLGTMPLQLSVSGLGPPLVPGFDSSTVGPGLSETLSIGCLPNAPGVYAQQMRIANNDPDESPALYNVVCNAAPDASGAFRGLITAGLFTARATDKLFQDSFE